MLLTVRDFAMHELLKRAAGLLLCMIRTSNTLIFCVLMNMLAALQVLQYRQNNPHANVLAQIRLHETEHDRPQEICM